MPVSLGSHIISIWDYQNMCTFYRRSQYDTKMTSDFFDFLVVYQSVQVAPIFLALKSLPWHINLKKRCIDQHLIDPQAVVAFDNHLHQAIQYLQTCSVVFHALRFSCQIHHF